MHFVHLTQRNKDLSLEEEEESRFNVCSSLPAYISAYQKSITKKTFKHHFWLYRIVIQLCGLYVCVVLCVSLVSTAQYFSPLLRSLRSLQISTQVEFSCRFSRHGFVAFVAVTIPIVVQTVYDFRRSWGRRSRRCIWISNSRRRRGKCQRVEVDDQRRLWLTLLLLRDHFFFMTTWMVVVLFDVVVVVVVIVLNLTES